ncbi:longevity assurance protein [Tritrichomonas foetus]|uniref:Longevity assurance protein n=1 Tax=Tritrichomonas foetus TaxID=1144522 RepID=A0A1J4JPB5_9EUKA|nr:longevity assurance protein [Tritrichomonas foetus]|eukprot:OHT00586.1 longevity assurance protein [Tritrichomonas foetus]
MSSLSFMEILRQMTVVDQSDLKYLGYASVVYFVYRYIMCNYILNKIGKACRVKNVMKFTHRSFDMVHYVLTCAVGLIAMGQRPYGHCVYYAKNCGDYLGQNPNGFECTILEKIYYIQFTTYYVVDLFYIWTSNEPIMLIIHHFVCISMIFSCVLLKSPVVGPSIMLLHDLVDVPLYVGKILLYLGFNTAKDFALYSFAILCTWFRIINYPMIIYHCLKIAVNDPYMPILYRGTCCLLCVLYILHLIWQKKILDNVIEIIHGAEAHDNRSDEIKKDKND